MHFLSLPTVLIQFRQVFSFVLSNPTFLSLSLSLSTRRPHFNDFTLSSPRLIAICLFLLFRIGREQNIKKFQRISEVRAILSRPQGPGGV